MLQSLFSQYVGTWFTALVANVVSYINGGKAPLTYLHKEMLSKEYSPTLKFSSIQADGTTVAADIVAMDSPLPLKKRDSLSKFDGDIPKMGMAKSLNERTMSDIDIMMAQNSQGSQTQEIVKKIFGDIPKVITGIYERLEFMFLEALSTGVTATTDLSDTKNVGVGIRLDYQIPAANKHGVTTVWSNTGSATPIADIQRVLDQMDTDGVMCKKMLMDKTAFNNFIKCTDVKTLFAFNNGFAGSNIIAPTVDQINAAVEAKWGITIQIINRTIKTEKDGTVTNTKPWADGTVCFVTRDKVGRLVWGNLAEKNRPVAGVTYQTADDFILVSKFSVNQPSLAEFTNSQAIVVPVIDNANEIYLLDTKTVGV